MKRRVEWWQLPLALLLLATAWCPRVRAQDSTTWRASWTAHTLRQWSLLYREFETEFLGCLYGATVADTVQVGVFVLADAKPSMSTTTGSNGQCPDVPGFLGTVHSHPGAAHCAFSRQDLLSFAYFIRERRAIVDVLICKPNVAVIHWRFRRVADMARCTWDPEAEPFVMWKGCESLNAPSLPREDP